MNITVSLTEQEVIEAVREFAGRRLGDQWTGVRARLFVDKESSEVTASCDIGRSPQTKD